jgi:hypothetical protein
MSTRDPRGLSAPCFRPALVRAVLGVDLKPGDRVGSVDKWQIVSFVREVRPGACGALRGVAELGLCACWGRLPLGSAPHRVGVGANGGRRVFMDHMTYGVVI